MTRFEAEQRSADNLRILAPLIGHWQTEMLDLIIQNVVLALQDSNRWIEKPDKFKGRLMTKLVSPLARSLNQFEAGQTVQFLQTTMAIAQADPEVLNEINFKEMLRGSADDYGQPARYIKFFS